MKVFEKNKSKVDFLFEEKGVSVYIKREDLLHEHISGNKFRKLKYNIFEAKALKKETILTFGGAFSNHITATAYAGRLFGIKTIGIIRGDELGNDLEHTLATNDSLKFAAAQGMQFKFVSRTVYREKTTKVFIDKLKQELGDFYLVPEGGTNALAIKGCEEILTQKEEKFDYICLAVGTGGTISGIIKKAKKNQIILGFPALKGGFLQTEIIKYVDDRVNWELIGAYHFGGFAKINETLVNYINNFKKKYEVALDPIYTGKMMFGVQDLIKNNYFKKGTKIVVIHTGGLQGIKAMNNRLVKKGLPQIV